ncbi:MAG: hypothetical protein AAGM22_09095 [Acidobacteriota bacterium]
MATDPPPIPPIPPIPPPPPETDLRERSFEEEYGTPADDSFEAELAEDAVLYGPDIVASGAERGYGCFSGLVLGFLIACALSVVVFITGQGFWAAFKIMVLVTLGGGLVGMLSPETTSFEGIIGGFFGDLFD